MASVVIGRNDMQFIVITGNPPMGLFFYGPFNTADKAHEWAEANHDGQDWWVSRMNEPTEECE